MAQFSPEHAAYHALAILLESNYRELRKAWEAYGSWETAWRNRSGAKSPEDAWRTLEKFDVRLILKKDADYPPLLREIPHPPFGLYIRGTLPLSGTPTVAIVGTRKATLEGKESARMFAAALAGAGCCIVSGLALGTVAAADEGVVAGDGKAIAVLAGGLDRCYPRQNEWLGQQIIANGGALVSEYPPGTPPLPYRFLERNRIVSGLSLGVLMIEAPERSGSLATARFALEQNRSVFVLPGPARHPNFAGSHALIRNGAELVTEPAQILTTLGFESQIQTTSVSKPGNTEEQIILEILRGAQAPLAIDKIIEHTKLNAQTVNRTLSVLALKNAVNETASGYTVNSL